MTPEQKQRLSDIQVDHSPYCRDKECNTCFLLSLLDQAQRDTERVKKRALELEQLARTGRYCLRQIKSTPVNYARWLHLLDETVQILDKAALARGEGEK